MTGYSIGVLVMCMGSALVTTWGFVGAYTGGPGPRWWTALCGGVGLPLMVLGSILVLVS